MKKLDYDIKKEFASEIRSIDERLRQLENNRIYEITKAKMDGYLSTNARKLRTEIAELLFKIQNGKEGSLTEIIKCLEINKEEGTK